MKWLDVVAVAMVASLAAACSNNSGERSRLMVTAPSVAAPGERPGGISGPAVVAFPARADGVEFRAALENKYVAMGRRPAPVDVDAEGEATWVGEYYRYRVNGCDHDTATQRVMAQIDGGAPGQICSLLAFPENAVYPPRDHVVDFRRQLGAKYRAMGRSAQSAVDADGAAIWLGEYYRYRTSGCDHATATNKVMQQIDGQAAAPTCAVACAYFVQTPMAVSGNGGTYTVELRRTSGSCDWVAVSDVPWITLSRPIAGTDRSPQSFTVAANTGGERWGRVRFIYPGGVTNLDIQQPAPSLNLGFEFFDPATSTSPVTECLIRTTATICTLNAVSSTLPSPITNYDWKVEYAYSGSKVRTQTGALPSFSFTETCGAAPPEGAAILMAVTLTVTDAAGNRSTVTSGQGSQPPLQLRVFTCS